MGGMQDLGGIKSSEAGTGSALTVESTTLPPGVNASDVDCPSELSIMTPPESNAALLCIGICMNGTLKHRVMYYPN